jgi:hypothetical protein
MLMDGDLVASAWIRLKEVNFERCEIANLVDANSSMESGTAKNGLIAIDLGRNVCLSLDPIPTSRSSRVAYERWRRASLQVASKTAHSPSGGRRKQQRSKARVAIDRMKD